MRTRNVIFKRRCLSNPTQTQSSQPPPTQPPPTQQTTPGMFSALIDDGEQSTIYTENILLTGFLVKFELLNFIYYILDAF